MRALSRAEAQVVASLLIAEPATLAEKIRASGLPERTYQVARRRMTQAGWIMERYVPNPVCVGCTTVTFAVASPFVEHFPSERKRWQQMEGNVVLWETPNLLFGVFFDSSDVDHSSFETELGRSGAYSSAFALRTEATSGRVPSYFDFEGSWSRVVGRRPVSYPCSFSISRFDNDLRQSPPNGRLVRTLRETLTTSQAEMDTDGDSGSQSQIDRRLAFREAIAKGYVTRRMFLNLPSLPGYRDWRLHQVLIIHGTLRPAHSPADLFHDLTGLCSVTPFLFASNSSRVLLAGLSPPPSAVPVGGRALRRAMSSVLAEYLESIVVHREPLAEVSILMNHTYTRLLREKAMSMGNTVRG